MSDQPLGYWSLKYWYDSFCQNCNGTLDLEHLLTNQSDYQACSQCVLHQPYAHIAGHLYYDSSANMSVSIYDAKCHHPEIITSYAGRYELKKASIIHYPKVGFSPNGIKQPKTRSIAFNSKHLLLQSGYTPSHRNRHLLVWEKFSS